MQNFKNVWATLNSTWANVLECMLNPHQARSMISWSINFIFSPPLKSSYTNRKKNRLSSNFISVHVAERKEKKEKNKKKCRKKERNVRKTINIKTFVRVKMSMREAKSLPKSLALKTFPLSSKFFGMREVLFLFIHDMEGEFLEKYSREIEEKKSFLCMAHKYDRNLF